MPLTRRAQPGYEDAMLRASPPVAPIGAGSAQATSRSGPLPVWQAIALLILAAVAFLPGQTSVPPLDRDEPRYTQATKQMMESGDYVAIRFQDAPRHKKPVGIHWLQAAAAHTVGDGAASPLWVYRLPSLLGATLALALVAWAARAFLPLGPSLAVAALTGATVILGVEARLAKTDAVLLASIVLMQGALARVWLSEGTGRLGVALLFWLALGVGILVKGPIAPMVAALTLAVLVWRTGFSVLRRLRPLPGVLLAAALCLPWFVAIGVATDGSFFTTALGRDFLGKAAGGQEGHGAPPLTHLAMFFVVAWPLAPFALAAARSWLTVRAPALLFAAAWAIPAWIVFELTPTKLPHYTLPLLPAVALATVAALASAEPSRWARVLAAALLALVPLGLLAAALGAPAYLAYATGGDPLTDGRPAAWLALAALVPVAFGLAASRATLAGRPMLSAATLMPAVASALAAQAIVWGLVMPRLEPVWVSARALEAARAAAPCEAPRIASVGGFDEPSLIFLAGTDTLLGSAEAAVAAAASDCTVILADEDEVARVRAATDAAGLVLDEAGSVAGFNISDGDPVRLTLFLAR